MDLKVIHSDEDSDDTFMLFRIPPGKVALVTIATKNEMGFDTDPSDDCFEFVPGEVLVFVNDDVSVVESDAAKE